MDFVKLAEALHRTVKVGMDAKDSSLYFPQVDRELQFFYQLEDSVAGSPYLHSKLMKHLRPLYEAWMMAKIDQGENKVAWYMCRRIKNGEINDLINKGKLSSLSPELSQTLKELEDKEWKKLRCFRGN